MTADLAVVAVVGCAAAAGALALPARPRVGAAPAAPVPPPGWPDLLRRGRAWWSVCAGLAGLLWVPGLPGALLGVLLAGGTWVIIGRREPTAQRRARESAAADLPHVVLLLAAALRSGGPPEAGLAVVSAALPGPAADRLAGLRARLALGADPALAWSLLAADPVLAPLGRALARAHDSGASVVAAVELLAGDLASRHRAEAEDRARSVGVRAALPLGLCLLPSFLLIGIVPVVGGLSRTLLH